MSRIIIICALAAIWTVPAAKADPVEEIYILRSVREPPMDKATEFCAKARTGVERPILERQFTFRSVATNDSRVIDANVKEVGSIHACFGPTDKPSPIAGTPAIAQFYGEILFNGISFTGLGECQTAGKPDFPEKGLVVVQCFRNLSNLPGEYVGGLLTTNTMVSRNDFGTETDPPGYIQPSIATVWLWKKRAQ